MTHLGRPIALALVLLTWTAPATIPHNHSAVASQAATASGVTAKPATLSVGTTVVAKLLTNIDSGTCKPGDGVEAEVTQDVSQNHKVVLKRGTRVIGHVVAVNASSAQKPESRIAISFDSISMKNGVRVQISLVIQALASDPGLREKLDLEDGRGLIASTLTAGSSGGSIGGPLPGGLLRPEDSGVYGIPGLSLAVMTMDTGSQILILVSHSENIRLAKGTQMVLRVAGN